MPSFPFIYLFLLLSITSAQDLYYVNQDVPSQNPDGSIENPFTSLDDIASLQEGSFEVVLLGSEVIVDSALKLPSNSQIKIRGQLSSEENSYFPLKFRDDAQIAISYGDLTLEGIEIIEENMSKDTSIATISVIDGHLVMNKTFVQNIDYMNTNYLLSLVQTVEVGSGMTIIDSQFSNLIDVAIVVASSELTVEGCTFTGITQTFTDFFVLQSDAMADFIVTFQNNTIEAFYATSYLGMVPTNFVTFYSDVNLFIFDGFIIRDSTFTNGCRFAHLDTNAMGFDTAVQVFIKNGFLENLYEEEDPYVTEQSLGAGLVFEFYGNITISLENCNMKNVNFKNGGVFYNTFNLTYTPAPITTIIASTTTVKDVYIENSANANFLNVGSNTILENIKLLNTSFNETMISEQFYPMFYSRDSDQIYIRNISGENHRGPLFRINNITTMEIYDCMFTGGTTSQKLVEQNKSFMELIRRNNMTSNNKQISEDDQMTIIRNFTVDRYTDEDLPDTIANYNNTYLILIRITTGKVFIEDSKLTGVDMLCINSDVATYVNISNLTVEGHPETPSNKIFQHNMFEFQNLQEIYISNSRFINNQNTNVFELFNTRQGDFFDVISNTTIFLDNITVCNNTANSPDRTGSPPILFNLYTPIKPGSLLCQNSIFQNNTISRGIFNSEGSVQMNITLINNSFKDNTADGPGVVIGTDSMEGGNTSIVLIGNTFINHQSKGHGGLFSFVASKHGIIAKDNFYKNVSAVGSGGVGYAFKTKLFFSETNGTYEDVSAGLLGGAWFFNTKRNAQKTPQVIYTDTKFIRSSASEKGGSIYIAQGDVSISNSFFQDNTAIQGGGSVYLLAFSSVQIDSSNFIGGSAPNGVCLYAEAVSDEQINLTNIQVMNVPSSSSDSFLLGLTLGSLSMINGTFKDIAIPLFSFNTINATFQHITVSNLLCNNTLPFCVLEGTAINLTLSNAQMSNITSATDLIDLHSSTGNAILSRLQVFDINNYDATIGQPFIIKAILSDSISVQDSAFSNTGLSGLYAQQTIVQIANTAFSNEPIQGRLLQSDTENTASETRFVVLNSSTSTIVDSSFLGSTSLTQSNGGAMLIIGNKGTHSLSGTLFKGNKASNGGAISVEGVVDSIQIMNSEFDDNQATVNGGCIFLTDQVVKNPISLIQNTFTGNQAARGGCLYVGNQSALVQNSLFQKNSATEGGVLLSVTTDAKTMVVFDQCNFIQNSAYLGSALMAYGLMNFDTATSTFTDNPSGFGNYMTSKPSMLRLKIYEFDETFLYLDNITPQIILSHPGTALIYDSLVSNQDYPLLQKSGRPPNYLIQFSLLDQLNNDASVVKQPILTVSIKNYTFAESQSIPPSFLGTTIFNFPENSGSLFVYNSLVIRSSLHTSISLKAQVQFFNSLTALNETVSLEWNTKIGPCTEGESYSEASGMCTPCPAGTYSFGNPYIIEDCDRCSGPLVCKGANIVYPQNGYWKIDRYSDNVKLCNTREACLGGEKDGGTNISVTGFCQVGYEGLACSTCSPGYAKFGTSQTCVDCQTSGAYYIKFIAYLFLQMAVIAYTIKAYVIGNLFNEDSESNIIFKAALIKVIIDFAHVLNMASEFSFQWPNAVDTFLDVLTKVLPNSRDALSTDCFLSLVKGSNQGTFFIKLLIIVLQPVALILIAIIVWIIIYKISQAQILNNPRFKRHVMITSIVIVYILQPNIIKATLQLFNCENYSSTTNPQYYLVEDTHIECWKPEHLAWALGLGIPSLVIWLIIPSLMLIYITIRKHRNPASKSMKKYNFIFARYEIDSTYWESIIFSRKFILIIIGVFVKSDYLQAYLAFFVLAIAYCLQMTIHPLSDFGLNIAEQLSLFCSACIFYSGLFFIRDNNSPGVSSFLLSIDAFTGALFFGYCIFLTHRLVKERLELIREALRKVLANQKAPGVLAKMLNRVVMRKTPQKKLEAKPTSMTELIDKKLKRKRTIEEWPVSLSCLEDHTDYEFEVQFKRQSSSFIGSREDLRHTLFRHHEAPTLPSLHLDLYKPRSRVVKEKGNDTDLYRGTLDDIMEFEDKKPQAKGDPEETVEEQPVSAFHKSLLKDNRFKDIKGLVVKGDNDETEESDIEKIGLNDIITDECTPTPTPDGTPMGILEEKNFNKPESFSEREKDENQEIISLQDVLKKHEHDETEESIWKETGSSGNKENESDNV